MCKYFNSENYICRQLVDNILLFPVSQEVSDFQGGVILNRVSHFVWKLLSVPCTKDEIVNAVSQEFNADIAMVETDIEELLNSFIEMKIVKVE
ncbi:MAG: PqqD family protein [Acutalibacteraceae bacterium]|nr:PqqD family protein [Acutalibacteraceae bacterium]